MCQVQLFEVQRSQRTWLVLAEQSDQISSQIHTHTLLSHSIWFTGSTMSITRSLVNAITWGMESCGVHGRAQYSVPWLNASGSRGVESFHPSSVLSLR